MSLDDAGEKVRQLLIAHTESNQTIPYSELVSLISNVYRQAILTDLLEMLKVLCEDDKIKAWNFLEQYVGMKENTK